MRVFVIFIFFFVLFVIPDAHAQYMDPELSKSSMAWHEQVEVTLQEYLENNFYQNPIILKDSIKTNISRGLEDVLPPFFHVRIIFDEVINEKIIHRDSIFKVDFEYKDRMPKSAKLVEVLDMEYKPPRKIDKDFAKDQSGHVYWMIQNIMCRQGFEKIEKNSDGSPACVKPESIPKLVERGWAKDDSEKELAYQIHDVVVHVDLLSYSFDDEYGNMVVNVVEFLKNPKNASHLTIWGNFHEFEEYCSLHNCDHAIAYLYEDKNGIYHKGDFWEWIESDKPTILEKTIECYKTFHCDSPNQDTFSKCLDSKINGTTIKEICVNADISIDEGCVSVSYQDDVRVISCE